ncbi:MAG: Y-family DNA polymerase [Burkholderiales bacterium]
MLWAAIRLPDLSLQLQLRGVASHGPLAIQDAGNRPRVMSCNTAALDAGVRPEMLVSAAFALAPELKLSTFDHNRETRALEGVALWAMQFTPTVNLASTQEILIEIDGCLRLFGGLRPLGRRIRAGLRELGYQAVVTAAPTPGGALLLARAGITTAIQDRHALRRALAPLRLQCLDQPANTLAALAGMGVRTLGQCLQLPRDGVARRFGQGLLDEIDRALGNLPDPRQPFVLPARYDAALELPAPVQETEPLLFAAKRLILDLTGFLRLRQLGATRLHLDLGHQAGRSTRVVIGLSAPNRDPDHLLTLLREKLATVALPEAVETLALAAGETRPLAARNQSLFADAPADPEERWRVIEHLRARLGPEAVYGLEAHPDHRPELAFRKTRLAGKSTQVRDRHDADAPYRPLWLLPRPLPLKASENLPQRNGPLTLLDGPERIESGWWDDFDVRRDYFIARDESGAKLWIFKQRTGGEEWFIHGVFG